MTQETVQIQAPAKAAVAQKSKAKPKDALASITAALAKGTRPAPAAKGKAETKTVVKKVKKEQVAFVPRKAVAGKPVFAIMDNGARPGSGSRLFAHTHAALTMFGMFEPKAKPVPRAAVASVIGSVAIGWHVKEGNFVEGPGMTIGLSSKGREKFQKRGIDAALANGFLGLFLDGKVGNTGVSPAAVFQIA